MSSKETTGLPPVSLPAGSYDMNVLLDGYAKAGKAAESKQGAALIEAVLNAHHDPESLINGRDSSIPADHRLVEVEHADLGIVEQSRIFDPKLAEKLEKDQVKLADKAAPDDAPEGSAERAVTAAMDTAAADSAGTSSAAPTADRKG